MKKLLICLFFFTMSVQVMFAERLFDYRGVFPADRSADARITNYMLLKKGFQISFAIEEQGGAVSTRIRIPRIKLTSDETIFIEKPDGIQNLIVPETGIYEITLVPATTEPGEMRFVLKVYESAASSTQPITVVAPTPAVSTQTGVVPLPTTPPQVASASLVPVAPVPSVTPVVQASATVATAVELSPMLSSSTVLQGSTPIQTTNLIANTASLTAVASASIAGPQPVLLSPANGYYLNPFKGFKFAHEDVNFIAADKLQAMIQVFLKTVDGREFTIKGRRFSPEPDVLAFIPEKVIPGAIYNLVVFDETLTRRTIFKVAAFPELQVDFSMAGSDVKARIFWHQSIDLMSDPESQVSQLKNSLLIIKKGDEQIASLNLDENLQPIGSIDRISYRAQPYEIELTIPVAILDDQACGIEVKALVDGNQEMVQVRKAFFKPVIEADETETAAPPVNGSAASSTASPADTDDFSDTPAAGNETLELGEPETEEIAVLATLPASATFTLEKSFSVLTSEKNKLTAWPQAVAWGENGGVWVLDSQLRQVSRFNRNGTLVRNFGQKGEEPGTFGLPVSLAIKNQLLYLADSTKRCIHIFAEDGTFKSLITGDPTIGGSIDLPGGISFRKNEMWIADRNQARILCFNDQGTFLGSFGSTAAAPILAPVSIRADAESLFILESNGLVKKFSPMGSFDATFQSGCVEATGFDLDPWGGIWVCDPVKFQLLRFARNGSVLATIKAPSAPQPWLPTGVSIRRDGRIAVSDAANKMLHIFAPVF
ncbi:MAG TPA: hypothetical protein PLM07_02675 [Candidatus Rifleibacterium sp.]|nr:hypothetical protein [Candidatus Rifleibacterium sp.]HPT44788.1 hypothetical protein [Candidatus Rifleibacterium sp.]